jgi:hypothetical protein
MNRTASTVNGHAENVEKGEGRSSLGPSQGNTGSPHAENLSEGNAARGSCRAGIKYIGKIECKITNEWHRGMNKQMQTNELK